MAQEPFPCLSEPMTLAFPMLPMRRVRMGRHGVRRVPDVKAMGAPSIPATCFPTASALAATWNVDLRQQVHSV